MCPYLSAPTSLGLDIERAHRDGRFQFPSVLDGLGGMWTLTSVAPAAAVPIAMPLQAATALLSRQVPLRKRGAALCSLDRTICVSNAASVTDELKRFAAPGELCSAQLVPGEALVSFGNFPAAVADSSYLQLRWRPKDDWLSETPFRVRATLRWLTPAGGWASEHLSPQGGPTLSLLGRVGSTEFSTSVKPSASAADAAQNTAVISTVRASHEMPLTATLKVSLPAGFSSTPAASRGLFAALSLTVTPLGCGRLLVPANVSASSFVNSDAAVGEVVHFSCRAADAYVDGSSNSTCLTSFRWSDAVPQCRQIRCGQLSPPTHGSFNVSGNVAVGTFTTLRCHNRTQPSHFALLQCQRSGQWTLLSNRSGDVALDESSNANVSIPLAMPSCIPDIARGACRANQTACTNQQTSLECALRGCHWCGVNSTLTGSPFSCQPPTPCFDTKRQLQLSSCPDTFQPDPVVPPLTISLLLSYDLCNITVANAGIRTCANLTLQECLSAPDCGICASERAIATIGSRNSTSRAQPN